MFRVGDKVAHPMHGAGVIDGIVTETVAGGSQDYYVFRMPVGGLVLKIPTAASAAVGLRSVVDPVKAAKLLRDLTMLEVERFTGSWNQRYRENMQKIKSGDLYEVARVANTGIVFVEGEGEAVITASCKDQTAECLVHVLPKATIVGTEGNTDLPEGEPGRIAKSVPAPPT